jgi:hypothetical protein
MNAAVQAAVTSALRNLGPLVPIIPTAYYYPPLVKIVILHYSIPSSGSQTLTLAGVR